MSYLQNFSSNKDVIDSYHAPEDALTDATVYLAWYGYGSYCGSSLVVFEKGGTLYEVNGSHCSCNGLEDQWEPVETSWDALDRRDYCGGECDGWSEAQDTLKEIVAKNLPKKVETEKACD